MKKLFALALLLALPAYGGMNISPGAPVHTHTDANTGGSTLAPDYLRKTTGAGSPPLNIQFGGTDYSGVWDSVLYVGANVADGGGLIDPAYGGIGFKYESQYNVSGTGSPLLMEVNLDSVDTTSHSDRHFSFVNNETDHGMDAHLWWRAPSNFTLTRKGTYPAGSDTNVLSGGTTGLTLATDERFSFGSGGEFYLKACCSAAFLQIFSNGSSGGEVARLDKTNTTWNFRGSVTSAKTCATNFTRIGPNFCLKTTLLVLTALTRDTCTTLTLPASDATALLLTITATTGTANVAGQLRQSIVGWWPTNACNTSVTDFFKVQGFEYVATPSTFVDAHTGQMIIGAATPYLMMQDDGGNQGSASYDIRGYFD